MCFGLNKFFSIMMLINYMIVSLYCDGYCDKLHYHLYKLCCLLYISAKRKQDTFWKISIAANVLYYVSQVSELYLQ